MRVTGMTLMLLILVGCSSQNIIDQNETITGLLIEDCEDGDNATLLGGRWYVATDSSKGAKSTISITRKTDGAVILDGEGYQSRCSFKMKYNLVKGSYAFNPFVLCGVSLLPGEYSQPFDATRFNGISYYFKGPAHFVRVETSEITDFCYYCYSVSESDVWKKVTVRFSDLSQLPWGKKVPFSVSSIKGISWQVTGEDSDSSTILIDDISFEFLGDTLDTSSQKKIVLEGDGITMNATLYKPEGDGPFPAVIVLPGGTTASNIGTVFSHHLYFGERFSSKGTVVLVLDYSSEKRSFFDTMQINDIDRAVEYLKTLPFINKIGIFLAGFSIGGANALRIGGTRNDIAGLVCYFSPCDWSVSGKGFGVKIQPIAYCTNITCPVLIFQGDADQVTDPTQSHLLYDTLHAMGKYAELVTYCGVAHGFTYKGAPAGSCVYNEEAAENSYLKVENFISTYCCGGNKNVSLSPCSQTEPDSKFTEYSFDRFSLRVEDDFMEKCQIDSLSERIETAIPLIETVLDWPYDSLHYKMHTIRIDLFKNRCIPHGHDSYQHATSDKPYVYMSLDDPKRPVPKSSYLHELIHIIAWEFNTLWIREGIAVYLNDSLGGYSTYPNYGRDLDSLAAGIINTQIGLRAFELIGKDGIPSNELFTNNSELKTPFYIVAAAFSRYLWRTIGKDKIIALYRSTQTHNLIENLTGKPMDEWKKLWLYSIQNKSSE